MGKMFAFEDPSKELPVVSSRHAHRATTFAIPAHLQQGILLSLFTPVELTHLAPEHGCHSLPVESDQHFVYQEELLPVLHQSELRAQPW